MTELKSFKRYSWLITAIFAVLVFISGLTANDISFLPARYQSIAVGIIGASALIVKLLPENYRVYIAEELIHEEYSDTKTPDNALQHYDDLGDEGV
ncbi:MAG: hypothetical protein IJF83_03590 [Methanobrevibacter sp.]|nr:hypothetical protein [Methanobrevibacter sp.]